MTEQRLGLPRLEEAEIQLLGTFLRNGALVRVSILDPVDFYSERHRTIFEAMKRICIEGETVDIVTVKACLLRMKRLALAGDEAYLMDLADGAVSSSGWESWEKLVRDYSVKRQLIQLLRDANDVAFEDSVSGAELSSKLQSHLNKVSTGRHSGVKMFSNVAHEWMMSFGQEKRPPLSTGFTSLDEILRIRPKQFGVVAARPGCGKSSWIHQVAAHVGMTQGEVLLNNLEMGDEQVMRRIMSQQIGISTRNLEDGNYLPQRDGRRMLEIQSQLNLSFCFCPTPEQLHAEAMRRKAQGNLALVATDYLQLMSPERPTGNDVTDLSLVTRSHKLMAMDLDVPVIGLSQFSRETAKQGSPKLHHMRGSGSLEQDADWVLFLYEESDEQEFFGGSPYKLWELPKQRDGARADAWRMAWKGECTRFSEFIA